MIFKCIIEGCSEVFQKRLELKNHLIYFHSHSNSTKQCLVCREEFPTMKQVKEHMKIHAEFKCASCGKTFSEKSYLKTHSKVHANERDKYECELCHKQFLFKANLKTHMKQKHEKQTYKCFVCDRELSTKQKLDHHFEKKHEKNMGDLEINIGDMNSISENESDSPRESDTSFAKGDDNDESQFSFTKEDFAFLEENCDLKL